MIEKKSGTTKKSRTALSDCLEYMREGDTLVITKIDRLARSARDLHNIVHDLESSNINLLALDQSSKPKIAKELNVSVASVYNVLKVEECKDNLPLL